ncbi:MAG: hypothetical protein ACQEWW_16885 [Bacillota bacterium]
MAANTNNALDKLKEALAEPIVKPESHPFDETAMGEYLIQRNQPFVKHQYSYKGKRRDKDTNDTIEVNENPTE